MKLIFCLTFAAFFLFLAPAADGAKRKLPTNLETEEGAYLKHLMDEPDPGKKTSLMEDFAAKHPTHEATPWLWGELQGFYLRNGKNAEAIVLGEKILAGDPDDLVIANNNLKAAEAAKNAALIGKWAIATSDTARRIAASPKPADEEEEATWKASADYAKQVDDYCDYALYALASQETQPGKRAEWGEVLAKRSPGSKYTAMMRPQLFLAYQQAGNHARALSIAEAELKVNAKNDDMLIYAASQAYERKDLPKVTTYAKQLLAILPSKPAPDGVSEADWTRNKNTKAGVAEWMLGVIASNEQRWTDADVHLRAALPNVGQNPDLQAETLFHLGLANYKMGEAKKDTKRILEALKFNQQCAAIPSAFQAQAKKNVAAIRSQYHIR